MSFNYFKNCFLHLWSKVKFSYSNYLIRTRYFKMCFINTFDPTWDFMAAVTYSKLTHDRLWDSGANRDFRRKSWGIVVLVNNRWCNPSNVTLKEHLCSPDMEVLALSLHRHCLPKESTHPISWCQCSVWHHRLCRRLQIHPNISIYHFKIL